MKLGLATGLLSAAAIFVGCATSGTTSARSSSGRYVLRVDRSFDRSSSPQPSVPDVDLPTAAYKTEPPADRWEVTIEGQTVIITPIEGGGGLAGVKRLEGKETTDVPSTAKEMGERHFEIDKGAFAGGRFVVRGDEAELTMFGSGVPIVSSERGKLVVTH